MKWQSHPQHPTLAYRFCLNLLTGACTTLTDRFLLILTDMYLFRKTIFILTFASARQFHSCFHARVIFSLYNAIFLLTSRQKFFEHLSQYPFLLLRLHLPQKLCVSLPLRRCRCLLHPGFHSCQIFFQIIFFLLARVCAAAASERALRFAFRPVSTEMIGEEDSASCIPSFASL